MGKGHKIRLWAHIRMFWDNAFYAIKGNLKKEKWKRGGRVRPGQKVMLGVTGPQSLEKSDNLWPPRPGSDCGPGYLRPLGSLVEQACKLYSKWLHSKKLWTESALHTIRGGQDYYNKCVRWSFQNTHPHIFPYFLKHSSSNSHIPCKEKQNYVINILYWTLPLTHKTIIFHWQLEGSSYSQMS